ncbi:Fanconi anemia core complex-associated protein 100 [Trichechus manatus latirostris]|uniref:Fanconi anemia core complex-associated protein 100 n=1 Tax=Trichechus manatus latirostris TaxID=127582 RepID=A0A2Y9DGC4_TRIMA|nr:Fanconi anemia core complex-associated protein 100 [Trichechus manatus latirostris]
MAGAAPRVDCLAGFRCPAGRLAAGRPRVLGLGAEVFLSTGSELVYAYDRQARQPSAVYEFPGQVWHLELLAPRQALYVLCARKGVYFVPLDTPSRSVSHAGGTIEDDELPPGVTAVGPDACLFPDATLCAFTLLDDLLVTMAQGTATWKMQLFERPCPGPDPRPGAQIGEVVFPAGPPSARDPGEPPAMHFLPVLCCVSPPNSRAPQSHLPGPGGFTLQSALFGLLFGADAALLESPVVLCGLPDGQLCCMVLKTLVNLREAPGDPRALVRILHHLEEPVVFIGALRTEPQAQEAVGQGLLGEDTHANCVVALGHHGRMLAIKASRDEAGNLVPELREYRLPGPILCAACGGGGHVYHGTPSDLCVVDLAQGIAPEDRTQSGLPPLLCPASLSICSIVALSVSPGAPEEDTELLVLSARGRLMACHLARDPVAACPARMTAAQAGQKIRDLLSGIGSISERVFSLKKAVDQRNQALMCLHEALDVSCALLSRQGSPKPIACSTTITWSRQGLREELTATCRLENRGAHSLGPGWTWCLQVLSSAHAFELDTAGTTTTYTVPVHQLAPGAWREVTLSLGSGEDGTPELPVTVSCALFYSVREVVRGALAPPGSTEDPHCKACPPDLLPTRDGICLPLGEHTVDLLQCLRFPGLAAPGTQATRPTAPTADPVDTFLGACREQGSEPVGPTALRAKYLPPSVASARVSVELLRAALENVYTGVPLCCATLQWLLAENAVVDVVRARALSSVQGVAPDGADIRLSVHEVALTDLCPAGPIQAMEIQVESASLADVCRTHHAVIGRIQTMVVERAARGSSPPDLRVQCLRQMHTNHEALLREVQALRDRLSLEDEASSRTTAEQLLQVYQQLRSPSLVLL